MTVVWKVHAGPSLHDKNVEPITVSLDNGSAAKLDAGDPEAWRVLLASVQSIISKR